MLMMEEHWVQLFTKQKRSLCIVPNFFWQRHVKKRGKYTNRMKVLPLDILKRIIENAYTSEKDDECDDEDKNKNVLDTGKELLRPIAIAQMMPQYSGL